VLSGPAEPAGLAERGGTGVWDRDTELVEVVQRPLDGHFR
jgi:hypothetical protein